MKTLEAQARDGKINDNASIRDRQSIIINAPIQKIWDTLIDLKNWPQWYGEIKDIKVGEVKNGEKFEWNIRGTHLMSQFQLVEEPTQITWTGRSKMVKAIFVWSLEDTGDQTIATVEESIDGFMVPIFTNHSKLHDILLGWLESLKKEAEK